MPVKNRRLHNSQGGKECLARGDALEVLDYPTLHVVELESGFVAIADQQIERNLRVKHVLRKIVKGEQVDGLLVQFVHTTASLFGSRLVQSGGERSDSSGLLGP